MAGQTEAHAIIMGPNSSQTIHDDAIAHQQNITAAFHRFDDQRKQTFRTAELDLDTRS